MLLVQLGNYLLECISKIELLPSLPRIRLSSGGSSNSTQLFFIWKTDCGLFYICYLNSHDNKHFHSSWSYCNPGLESGFERKASSYRSATLLKYLKIVALMLGKRRPDIWGKCQGVYRLPNPSLLITDQSSCAMASHSANGLPNLAFFAKLLIHVKEFFLFFLDPSYPPTRMLDWIDYWTHSRAQITWQDIW